MWREEKVQICNSDVSHVWCHLTLLLAITMLSDCTIADIFDGKEQVTTIFLSSLAGYLERDRISYYKEVKAMKTGFGG